MKADTQWARQWVSPTCSTEPSPNRPQPPPKIHILSMTCRGSNLSLPWEK